MSNIISIPFNNRVLYFQYQDIFRGGKNIDLQTTHEIFTENVYRFSKEQLNGTKIVIDAGSNFGSFAVMAAAAGATKVYAFEPNSKNYEIIKQNALLNNYEKIIEPINMALWNRSEMLKLIDFDRDSRIENVLEFESEESKEVVDAPDGAKLQVKGEQLGVFLGKKEITEVDVLKMDIEWSEYTVIPFLDQDVLSKIKYICIEFHGTSKAIFGNTVAHLTRTHCVQTLGSHERGGFLYCQRY